MTRLPIILLSVGLIHTALSASVAVSRPADFKTNCYLAVNGGCECKVVEGNDETTRFYSDLDPCRMSVELQTAENKKKLNAEIQQKFGAFKENCFPKPSGGCKCNVDEGQGEIVREFSEDSDCKKSLESQTADNKKKLNEEIKEKFGGFKENCFPKPSGGCKCNEKDAEGNEVVATYDDAAKCEASARVKREERPSQNVRDPVREKAQANYQLVINELKDKFKGLKEGCFPRPKGCLCTIGKTPEGRDITERRMKDVDCKCKEGERGPGCPAA
ncbi:ccg-1 [Pristionchus pacificus]|uniref:Ccg-1 n=1 Tax=Pristionchus pacificus TaxID=54126 RepID=A0A2A6CBC5_PRIPA|nr:ccg-1 [Pristionchus pacificus]|eukprot:PDM75525.1 ccg-1 [Pristionchus pacificus]